MGQMISREIRQFMSGTVIPRCYNTKANYSKGGLCDERLCRVYCEASSG